MSDIEPVSMAPGGGAPANSPVSFLDDVTPLVLTMNEEANLARTLEKLGWAKRILLVDSGSTDQTLAIAARFEQVEVVFRPFDSFANQCNFGLDHVNTPWVLSLDADYELSDPLIDELSGLAPSAEIAGYSAAFVYRIHGRPLRASLYPPRTLLYRRAAARYHDEGHGHRVEVRGFVKHLSHVVYHDDRKPLERWLNSQQRYARAEAAYLLDTSAPQRGLADRIRRAAWLAPIVILPYTLFVKGCAFEGWAGWCYALQRLVAESMIALAIVDLRLSKNAPAGERNGG